MGDFLRSSCTLTALAAFVAVFGVALIVMSIFTPIFSSAVHATPLAVVDKGLGFLFGVARGVLLIAVLFMLYNLLLNENERFDMVENSASKAIISDAAEALQTHAPTEVPDWLQVRIDGLMGQCEAPAADGAPA